MVRIFGLLVLALRSCLEKLLNSEPCYLFIARLLSAFSKETENHNFVVTKNCICKMISHLKYAGWIAQSLF